jgi:predicted porin
MKQFGILAAVAAVAALPVHAQTAGVTLFGALDAGVRYVKNGDLSVKSVSANGNNTSRFGFRGIEDVGDGLKIGFHLEAGFSPDTGTSSDATRLFNRRTTVSLLSNLGELRIGRDYAVSYLGFIDYDVWGDIGLSGVAKFDSSLGTARDTAVRSDNQIVYFTPGGLGGFYGRVGMAPGEGTVGKRYLGARAGYAAGPLDLSASYGSTAVAPVAGDDKFKTFHAGASYDLGIAKVSAYATRSKFAALKVANYYIGTSIALGAGTVRVSYLRSNLSGINAAGVNTDANDANQIAAGYLYNFSKRTALYTNVVRVSNKGASAVAVDRNPTLVAGKKSSGIELGLRQFF